MDSESICHRILELIEDAADLDEIKTFCEERLETLNRIFADAVEDEERLFQHDLA